MGRCSAEPAAVCCETFWSLMAQVMLSVPPGEGSVLQLPGDGPYFVPAEVDLTRLNAGETQAKSSCSFYDSLKDMLILTLT